MSEQNSRLDVVGIGNALVDVLTHEPDEFVEEQNLVKGSMTLIDEDRAHELYDAMAPATEVSGGSAANTVIGVASFGGTGAYIGKVRDDQLGEIFAHDLKALGVEFEVVRAPAGDPTGRCLILVTPDGQRTMSTYLGASVSLSPEDVDPGLIARSRILFLEGYLWDPPSAKAAMTRAAELATGEDQRVALTLSDSFCVDRHRDSFLELIDTHVDVLFANYDEILSLYRTDSLETAIEQVRRSVPITAITHSDQGSIIVVDDAEIQVPPEPTEVVDTTGAGDLYASGFLYGLARGFDLKECGWLGSLAASEVISHMGPRPEIELADLLE